MLLQAISLKAGSVKLLSAYGRAVQSFPSQLYVTKHPCTSIHEVHCHLTAIHRQYQLVRVM